MAHHHHHHHNVKGRNLFIAIVLNVIITLAQLIGGLYAGSLALLSDALHNFSDVMSLLISWFAEKISHKSADVKRTFGYKRAEIIATLFNASVLVGIGFFIIYEAIIRFLHPEPIDASWVIILGLLGILVNGGSIILLHQDAKESMNIKAAYLHLLGDVLTSVAVVVGGVVMHFWEIGWIDPLISVIIALYLIVASWGLIRESIEILMQFAPESVDLYAVAEIVKSVSDVENIHHAHLWRLNDHDLFFEAHIDLKDNLPLADVTKKLEEVEKLLKEQFHFTHITLQPEYRRCDDKGLISHTDQCEIDGY